MQNKLENKNNLKNKGSHTLIPGALIPGALIPGIKQGRHRIYSAGHDPRSKGQFNDRTCKSIVQMNYFIKFRIQVLGGENP